MNRLVLYVTVGILFAGAANAAESTSARADSQAAVAGGEAAERATETLGRNVRLDFQLRPLDKEDEEIFVVTASPWYETAIRVQGPDVRLQFAVSGTIELLDAGTILIHCEADMGFEGKDEEAHINILSSAVLEPGVDLELAKMGDKTLVVRASIIE